MFHTRLQFLLGPMHLEHRENESDLHTEDVSFSGSLLTDVSTESVSTGFPHNMPHLNCLGGHGACASPITLLHLKAPIKYSKLHCSSEIIGEVIKSPGQKGHENIILSFL